jgi:hypothetical protein
VIAKDPPIADACLSADCPECRSQRENRWDLVLGHPEDYGRAITRRGADGRPAATHDFSRSLISRSAVFLTDLFIGLCEVGFGLAQSLPAGHFGPGLLNGLGGPVQSSPRPLHREIACSVLSRCSCRHSLKSIDFNQSRSDLQSQTAPCGSEHCLENWGNRIKCVTLSHPEPVFYMRIDSAFWAN